ncbi:MAG: hypothetical protein ACKOPO_00175 [Novosphingobium sp.]
MAAALFGALLLFVAPVVPAKAQTISNIATARWNLDGQEIATSSNEVRLDVTRNDARITTFRPDTSSSTSTPVSMPVCAASTASIVTAAATAATQSTQIAPANTYRVGEMLVFRIDAPLSNRSATAIDTVKVLITNSSGDRETFTVAETAADSGQFVGAIQTGAVPMPPLAGDCRLSSANGDTVRIEAHQSADTPPIVTTVVSILADPFGLVFDSEDGTPVSGVRVSLVEAATGAPASVFADDGITPWPSTVISGQPIIDGAGNVHPMPAGDYRFPLAPLGTYRLLVTPPAPYSAPSTATPAQLSLLTRPDGVAMTIADGSFGKPFALNSPNPVRLDIPVDRPGIGMTISKAVSKPRATPGDAVIYTLTLRNPDPLRARRNVTITDIPAAALRLRKDSLRINGASAPGALNALADGSRFAITLDQVAPGGTVRITYAMSVRADAQAGNALNSAEVSDPRGTFAKTSVNLAIDRETIAGRMTVIGRVTEGPCSATSKRRGIPGVRIMLEDGSFALTDADGRYHFEALMPGTHVVQAQRSTLPAGGRFVDCSRSTSNAGSATSRFVRGQGGSLVMADFHAVLPAQWQPAAPPAEVPKDDAVAAGGETDWLAMGDGPIDFLFPEIDHNPRVPAVRVVIRHRPGQKVELRANGKPVDALSFDGMKKSADGRFAVSTWRAIPLNSEITRLSATVRNEDGSLAKELARDVAFAAAPANAQLIAARSHLVADGATRPVIAIRLTDRKGRPVRSGMSGSVSINAPYESAQALDAMQLRQLTGLGGASPTWTVKGDDGVALIELAPTMVSGPLHLTFSFAEGEMTREQELDAWIVPGDQEWTVVGLVEGSVGARSVADNMERPEKFDSDLGRNARVALYAKGRVLGKFLLTAAYDSAKQKNEQNLTGAIDPNAYYTVFADGSVRRFDAASREKLYVRIETRTFYAIYGDIETGFDRTDLARYTRSATGVKAEGRLGAFHVQGFAAKVETRHRRDEIQASGLSGPYPLSSRALVPNSERVSIEVRDRFRSEIIVSRRDLERFVDYDIDLLSGTITFKAPILSRDFDLNPQFIVIDYETDGAQASGTWNGGLRGDVALAGGKVTLGATAISDKGDGARTDVIAADARVRIGMGTELRGEIAASKTAGATSAAWQVEAEHRSGNLDVLAYSRRLDAEFGLGEQNGAERGRQKFGVDGRYRLGEHLSVTGSLWRDDSLSDATRREAVQMQASWRSRSTDLRLGFAHFADRLADGTSGASTVIEGGATRRLLGNRLELDASSAITLGSKDSIDLPTRHRLGARYALTSDVRLTGSYEIASGSSIEARSVQAGVEIAPWTGARISSTLGQQTISEYGKRSFAAFGLAQSLPVTPSLTIDATLDGNRRIGGVDVSNIVNPAHPVASGGFLGQGGTLFENFTATTLGASWRKERWVATVRGEWRDGELADRKGATFGVIRQLGEGSMVGAGATWTRSRSSGGAMTEVVNAAISAAHRPSGEQFAMLTKLEYRSDKVSGAVGGETDFAGRTALGATGNAASRRLIASLSTNWSPRGKDKGELTRRTEVGLFVAGRYNLDRVEDFDLSGFTVLAGADLRFSIGDRVEVGGRATVRRNMTDHSMRFSAGPEIGFVPAKDVLFTMGYNLTGFRDRDFSALRSTDKGFYANVRMKFDANSFSVLGLGR